MSFFTTYRRVLTLLKPELNLVLALSGAGLFLAVFQIAQVVLFANFLEALAKLQSPVFYLVLWAILGL
ncbi:MAG: hypothetical protein V4691_04140, partial [Pseudomonadota bacterium]